MRNRRHTKSYRKHMLTRKEKRLLGALFEGGVSEADIQLFTDGLDVDTSASDYLLMLSYLGFKTGWKWFPEEIVPRLQGIYRYFKIKANI